MSQMVERVAQKIDDELKLYRQGLDWQDPEGPVQRAARAAIEAMREPTTNMLDEGPGDPYLDAYVWGKIINEALR